MDSTILAIRAVTAEYAKRLLWLPLIIGVAAYVVVLLLVGWIASSAGAWWWFLAILPTGIFMVALALWILARLFAMRLAPSMNKAQRQAVRHFSKRIDKVAEHVGTPKFILIFRITKDLVARPTAGKTFIGEIAQEPGEMRRAFDDLRSLF